MSRNTPPTLPHISSPPPTAIAQRIMEETHSNASIDFANEPENRDNWPDGIDITTANKVERDAFMRFKVWEYEQGYLCDMELWEQFKEDFQGFTLQHLRTANKSHIRRLRFALRCCGV